MLQGDRFGKWTVEVPGHECIVRCDCGAVRTVPIHELLFDRSTGCTKCVDVLSYGEWIVLRFNGSRCLCVCSCGRIDWVNKYSLTNGSSTRCEDCRLYRMKFSENKFDIRDVMLDVEDTLTSKSIPNLSVAAIKSRTA